MYHVGLFLVLATSIKKYFEIYKTHRKTTATESFSKEAFYNRCLPVKFAKSFRTTYSQNTSRRLPLCFLVINIHYLFIYFSI